MIYIFPKGGNPLSPIFQFDCELSEERNDESEITEFAIESNATVSDFVWIKPVKWSVTGKSTSAPLGGAFDIKRLQRLHDALVRAFKARSLVTLVTQTWINDGIITRVKGLNNFEIGEALDIDFDFQEVLRATPETVRIDPSRLRNRRKASGRMSAKQRIVSAEAIKEQLAKTGRYTETAVATQPVYQVTQ